MKKIADYGPYEIYEYTAAEFLPEFKQRAPAFFEGAGMAFNWRTMIQGKELELYQKLQAAVEQNLFQLFLVARLGEEWAGWHYGTQESGETFFMISSVVYPDHRRKGLYTRLAEIVLEKVKEAGFQRIYSYHQASNNAIIIAKMRLGFTITGFEMHDTWGVGVRLTYLANPIRQEILKFRDGSKRPSEEVKKLLKI